MISLRRNLREALAGSAVLIVLSFCGGAAGQQPPPSVTAIIRSGAMPSPGLAAARLLSRRPDTGPQTPGDVSRQRRENAPRGNRLAGNQARSQPVAASRIESYLEEVRDSGLHIKLIAGTIMAPAVVLPAASGGAYRGRPGWHLLEHHRPVVSRPSTAFWKSPWADNSSISTNWDSWPTPISWLWIAARPVSRFTRPITSVAGPAPISVFGVTRPTPGRFRRGHAPEIRHAGKARHRWGTTLPRWEDVKVPQPGTRPGACWEDVLLWYRDSKRRFVASQVAMYKRVAAEVTGGRLSVLLYVPGTEVRPIEWQNAVATGEGGVAVRIMADSSFLVDLAAREDIWLQYTGVDNRAEVAHVVDLLKARGLSPLRLWGENCGTVPDVLRSVDVVLSYGLWGVDFTHPAICLPTTTSRPDRVSPT